MTTVTGLARKDLPQLRREKRAPQDGRTGGPPVAERLTTEVASRQRGAEGCPSWGPVPRRASPQNAGLRGQWGSLGESPRAVGSRDSAPAGTHGASHTPQPRAEAGTLKEPDRTHRLTGVSLRRQAMTLGTRHWQQPHWELVPPQGRRCRPAPRWDPPSSPVPATPGPQQHTQHGRPQAQQPSRQGRAPAALPSRQAV